LLFHHPRDVITFLISECEHFKFALIPASKHFMFTWIPSHFIGIFLPK